MGGMYGLDQVLARVSNPGRGGSGNGPETDPRWPSRGQTE